MFVVAVGRRARTVKVQSSWFCSKRRRKLYDRGVQGLAGEVLNMMRIWRQHVLLLGYAIATHALARIIELSQDILGCDVAGADNTSADGQRCAIALEPLPRRGEHGGEWENCRTGKLNWWSPVCLKGFIDGAYVIGRCLYAMRGRGISKFAARMDHEVWVLNGEEAPPQLQLAR